MKRSFAEIILQLRKDSGLGFRAFARKCGISVSTLQRYESGENEPSQENLRRISRNLNRSISVLVGEEELRLISEKELKKLKKADPEK